MEAAVTDKEAAMVEWNDGRLDERFLHIDQRFDQMDKKMDDGFARVDAGFARIDAGLRDLNGRFDVLHGRLDSMLRTLIQVGAVMMAAVIGVLATMIAVQL
jgi:hypothetical protein